jgi:hypothetical protein
MDEMPSWMKSGKDAEAMIRSEDERIAATGGRRVFRFIMKPETSAQVTFLDGSVDEDGMLSVPMYYEHMIYWDGKWQTFVCVKDDEPCPVCEGGDSPYLIGLLTIIDHREKTSSTGKVYVDDPKLYAAKRMTLKLLQRQAEKRDGLRGCRFEITRVGKREPAVGSSFEFEGKLDESTLVEKYGADSAPLNYEEEVVYKSAKELNALGIGSGTETIGANDASTKVDEQL